MLTWHPSRYGISRHDSLDADSRYVSESLQKDIESLGGSPVSFWGLPLLAEMSFLMRLSFPQPPCGTEWPLAPLPSSHWAVTRPELLQRLA